MTTQAHHVESQILFLVNSPKPCKHCSQVPAVCFMAAAVVTRPMLLSMPTRVLFSVLSSTYLSENAANSTRPPGSVRELDAVLLSSANPQVAGAAGQAASLSCKTTRQVLSHICRPYISHKAKCTAKVQLAVVSDKPQELLTSQSCRMHDSVVVKSQQPGVSKAIPEHEWEAFCQSQIPVIVQHHQAHI